MRMKNEFSVIKSPVCNYFVVVDCENRFVGFYSGSEDDKLPDGLKFMHCPKPNVRQKGLNFLRVRGDMV